MLDYTVGGSGIADGASLKLTFRFYSDWALFQTSDPSGPNYISAELQFGPLLQGQLPATAQALVVRFDQKGHERPFQKAVSIDVVDGYLNAGDHVIIRLGDRRQGGGTRVQTFAEEGFRLVLEDRWGNVCINSGGMVQVVVELLDGEEHFAATTHQLELPTSGWATVGLNSLYLPSGHYRLRATTPRAYYADLHVHAHDTVGTNSPACNAAYARDVASIDVLGYTANDFQITDVNWAKGLEAVDKYNEAGRFVVYPVQE